MRHLFPIHKTLFGEMWTFSDSKDHLDTSYTNVYLGPHNDNTYFNDASGLQILHCIQHDGTGGESLLVDGFNVALNLRKENREAFDRLKSTHVPCEYIETGKHHKHIAPIIQFNEATQQLEQVNIFISVKKKPS